MKKRIFIKFGKEEHLQCILEGKLRFAPARTYIDIEKKEANDKQGDRLEGKTLTHSNNVTFTSHETGNSFSFTGNILMEMNYEGVDSLPIFCISYVDADMECVSEGKKIITIPKEYVAYMRRDFPEATHALIILDADDFTKSVTEIEGHTIIGESIHYFDYSIDSFEHVMYLFTGDENNVFPEEGIKLQYSDRHRLLLCKNIKYEPQNEYRFIALDESIGNPEFYAFDMRAPSLIIPVEGLEDPIIMS